MFRDLAKMFVACALVGMCAGSVFATLPDDADDNYEKTWFDLCPYTASTDLCEKCCANHTKTPLGYQNCLNGSDCEDKPPV